MSSPDSARRSRPNWRSGSRIRKRPPRGPSRRFRMDRSTSRATRSGIRAADRTSSEHTSAAEPPFEAAREDGEAAPEESLGVVQKLVAPIDRRIERLLAMRARGIAGSQDPEPSGEAVVEGLQAESVEPDCGELDREGHAVELRAHARHGGRIALVEMEIAIDGLRPLDEQRDRVREQAPRQEVDESPPGATASGTSTTISPVTPSACRLVARMRTSGAARRMSLARRAADARTCSQLSRIRRHACRRDSR